MNVKWFLLRMTPTNKLPVCIGEKTCPRSSPKSTTVSMFCLFFMLFLQFLQVEWKKKKKKNCVVRGLKDTTTVELWSSIPLPLYVVPFFVPFFFFSFYEKEQEQKMEATASHRLVSQSPPFACLNNEYNFWEEIQDRDTQRHKRKQASKRASKHAGV